MFSDKCPICECNLVRIPSDGCEIYCCMLSFLQHHPQIYSHYNIEFKDCQLISECFSFNIGKDSIIVRSYFLTNETRIYNAPGAKIFNDDEYIMAPCYLGYGQIDKIKNYLVMV